MKIAILLSGHLRSYKKTYESFNRYFKHLNADIFCHTWNILGHSDKVWWNETGDNTKIQLTQNDIDNIDTYYKPKLVKIDSPKIYVSNNPLYNQLRGYNALKNMWESIYQVNELKKKYEIDNNIRYDFILKTRYDIKYEEIFDIKIIENRLNHNASFIESYTDKKENLYNDSFYFAKSNYFDSMINDIRDNIDDYLYASIDKFKVIEGEASFTVYLRKHTINEHLDYSKFIFKCGILRLNEDKYLPLYP